MAKYTTAAARPMLRTPMHATNVATGITTHEGAAAFEKDAKTELFTLAASFLDEDTFYESRDARLDRYRALVRLVAEHEPAFIAGDDTRMGLARFLRTKLGMRSGSIVMACEYAAVGAPDARRVVDAVCQRADEPAEVVGYWLANHGRNIPSRVKRGVGDAARRLYTEANVARYDGASTKQVRIADVLELCHVQPRDDQQSQLFKWVIDRRHNRSNPRMGEPLTVTEASTALEALPADMRRNHLRQHGPAILRDAGWRWERLSSWLPGGMDAEAWQALIDSGQMGVLALARNLRNFDQAGISSTAVDQVIAKITNPADVAGSKIWPHQVFAAYQHAPSDNWRRALNDTFTLTCQNVPALPGGTLVAVDTSASMTSAPLSAKGKMCPSDIAAVFAAAVWARQPKDTTLTIFGDGHALIVPPAGSSPLQVAQAIASATGKVGHSTYGHTCLRDRFDPAKHRRAIILTDGQMHDDPRVSAHVPTIWTADLQGYRASAFELGTKGRYGIAGWSDAVWPLLDTIENRKSDADWPF